MSLPFWINFIFTLSFWGQPSQPTLNPWQNLFVPLTHPTAVNQRHVRTPLKSQLRTDENRLQQPKLSDPHPLLSSKLFPQIHLEWSSRPTMHLSLSTQPGRPRQGSGRELCSARAAWGRDWMAWGSSTSNSSKNNSCEQQHQQQWGGRGTCSASATAEDRGGAYVWN